MTVVAPVDFPNETIRGSHVIAGRCDVYVAGAMVSQLPIVDGEVVLDRTKFVRGSCEVELLASWPGATDPLNPYSSEIQLYRGAASLGSSPVLVPVGRYRVDDIRANPNRRTTVIVTGSSRESYLVDDRFAFPRTFAGDSAADIIATVVSESLPGSSVINTAANPGSATGTWDEDRAALIQHCADACVGEFYGDYEGVNFLLAPIPRLTDPPKFTVDAGAHGVLVEAVEGLSRQGIYNAVTVRAQNTTEDLAPVQATAYDLNPASPTRWDGPFGHRRRFYSSPVLTTVEQCLSAAESLLDDALGLHHSVDLTSVANPALRPGDVITVVFRDGTTQTHLVDALTVPLGIEGTQRLTTRANPTELGI